MKKEELIIIILASLIVGGVFGYLVGVTGSNPLYQPVPDDQPPLEDPECILLFDCDIGNICVDGTCVDVTPEGGCTDDGDCPDDLMCLFAEENGYGYGYCYQTGNDCTSNEECGENSECIEGYCFETGNECTIDSDCPIQGNYCFIGNCIGCIGNVECFAGQECVGGQCVDDPTSFSYYCEAYNNPVQPIDACLNCWYGCLCDFENGEKINLQACVAGCQENDCKGKRNPNELTDN